jgi:predicted transposase/invertase (TIGR01784 family)
MRINNPHDKVFKEVESIKENARDLLQAFLPAQVLKQLDLSTLELDNHSYTDEKLQAHFSDLVYHCCLQEGVEECLIAILLEHKSYRVDYPHLQLLHYILNIWQENIKQQTSLKLVIPIIFYHGVKKWEYKPLASYFPIKNKFLSQFIPDFTYLLADLLHYSDDQIKEQLFKRDANKILTLVMKHIFDEVYIERELGAIFKLGELYYTIEEGEKFLISILLYLFYSLEDLDAEKILEDLRNVTPKRGELTMTIAEKLKEKGLKEGLKEGLNKGLMEGKKEGLLEKAYEAARKMLKKEYPLTEIAEITGLDLDTIKDLQKTQV